MRDHFAIEAQAHLVALSDEREFVPIGVGLLRHGDLLRLQQHIEVGGQRLFAIEIRLAALANLQVHHARLVIDERDAALRKNAVAEMPRMDARRLASTLKLETMEQWIKFMACHAAALFSCRVLPCPEVRGVLRSRGANPSSTR